MLETSNYQVFDMKYGVTLVDRNANTDKDKKEYKNLFMQGDDCTNFLKEIDSLIDGKVKKEFIDHFLSAYDEITTNYSTAQELEKIGINVREKRKSPKKR